MMKKIILSLLCLISIFVLAGCETSDDDRLKLFSALQKEKLIPNNLTLVDEVKESWWCGETSCNNTYYIYEDNNGSLIGIKYKTYYDKYHSDYEVDVYTNIILNDDYVFIANNDEEYDYISSPTKYQYSDTDEHWTYSKKYEIGSSTTYSFDKKKTWFRESYVLVNGKE